MKAVTRTNNQSLLTDAFQVLLENLGPRKTLQIWRTLIPSSFDYLKERQKIFKGKSVASLYKEAEKFNRSR